MSMVVLINSKFFENFIFLFLILFSCYVRTGYYRTACNIKGMFLGIEVSPEDWAYLKVFYRSNHADPLRTYQCTHHVFGLCCSPFVAISTVLRHAQKKAYKWPLALKLLRENTIEDNILASLSDKEDLKLAKQQLIEFFESMSLVPHKRSSNDTDLISSVPEAERAKVNIRNDPSSSIRTLGFLWLAETDEFQYVYEPQNHPVGLFEVWLVW